jgi:hypothetical protein
MIICQSSRGPANVNIIDRLEEMDCYRRRQIQGTKGIASL